MNPNAMRGTIVVAVMVLLGAIVLGLTNRTGVPSAVADVTVVEEEVVEEPTLDPAMVDPAPTATPNAANMTHSSNLVRVQVANASSVGGVAGRLTQRLVGSGYQTADATNGAPVQQSTVFYKPGYEGDADAILDILGQPNVPVQPMPDVPEGIEGFDPTVQILIVVGPDELSTS